MDPITDEIKRRADLVEIVGQHVALRPAGNDRWKACCPFHDEKTPSFYVSREKGFYKCFGCGASGDVFKFVQQVENLSFPDAKKQLAERYGVALPQFSRDLSPEQQAVYEERDRLLKIMAAAAAFFREQLRGNAGMAARDYARERGLSNATQERFGIGYAPDSWDALQRHLVNQYNFSPADAVAAGLLVEKTNEDTSRTRHYDRYRHRLMFPIWDERGRVIAFGGRALEGGNTGTPEAKYINSPEGPLFKKSRTLYAWHVARPEVGKREAVIITEGYMDTIALHEAGFTNTIATLGTALTVQHVQMLARLAPRTTYLCYDGDSAGLKAAVRTAPLFAAQQLDVRVVTLPDGDDPDTHVRKHGEVGLQNQLNAAPTLTQFLIESAIAEYDFKILPERLEAMRAAAEIIVDIPSTLEQESFVAWLTDKWAVAEGVNTPQRVQGLTQAIKREILAASKRKRQGDWVNPRQDAIDQDNSEVRETLLGTGTGQSLGVTRAERSLLCAILGNPTWRPRILKLLAIEKWTHETHAEIVSVLMKLDDDDPGDPAKLVDQLSPEAGSVLGELILSDDAQVVATDDVVLDWVARIKNHWAKKAEQEMLEYMRLKLERGEPFTEEERKAYNAALIATRRKAAAVE